MTILNGQACGHVQNMLDNLRTQLMQITNQQKIARQVANSSNCYYIWQYQISLQIRLSKFADRMKNLKKITDSWN